MPSLTYETLPALEDTMLAQFMLCTLLAAAAAEGTPAQPVSAERFELIAIEKAIVEQTNAQRARHGLPALEVDENLMESARRHTIWMHVFALSSTAMVSPRTSPWATPPPVRQ